MSILSLKEVKKSFNNRSILNDIELEIESHAIISIAGKSGSGKTTLLSIMSGLLKPDSGKVIYRGNDIYKWADFTRSKYRNKKVGFIFQSFNLLSEYTVYQNIIYPAMLNSSTRDINKQANYLIDYLGIDNIRNQLPATISGGEKQRAAIARAMINNPEIILADEPTGNLDDKTGKSIFSLFKDIRDKYNILFVIATHDKYIIKNSDCKYNLNDSYISSAN